MKLLALVALLAVSPAHGKPPECHVLQNSDGQEYTCCYYVECSDNDYDPDSGHDQGQPKPGRGQAV